MEGRGERERAREKERACCVYSICVEDERERVGVMGVMGDRGRGQYPSRLCCSSSSVRFGGSSPRMLRWSGSMARRWDACTPQQSQGNTVQYNHLTTAVLHKTSTNILGIHY